MLLFFVAINFVMPLTFAELFTIGRFLNRNGSHSADWIELSQPTCASFGQVNLCQNFGSEIEVNWKKPNYKNTCYCRCPSENATFGYYDRKWQCKDNEKVRNLLLLQESPDILFNKEKTSDPLRVLDYEEEKLFYLVKKLEITRACPVVTEVRYLRCNGSWSEAIQELKQVFSIDQKRRNVFRIKVNRPGFNNSSPLLSGKLLKLVMTFKCVAGVEKFRVLLMKFHGIQNCKGNLKLETATRSPSLTSTNLPVVQVRNDGSTSTTAFPPAPREPGDTDKSTSGTSAALVALAITGSLILVALAVILFFKRWRRRKKCKSTSRKFPAPSPSEKEQTSTGRCQLNKSLPRHEGLSNEAFLGDGFFRANQLAVGLSVGNAAAQLLGTEELRRSGEEKEGKEEDGYFQPIHLPDDMSLDEYKESLKSNADEEIYAVALDDSFQDSNTAGTRPRVTRIFEESSGEIVIAIDDSGQIKPSPLVQTAEALDETYFDQDTDSTALQEQLYVNVASRDGYNYDNYEDELGCYSSKEEEDNTFSPPVPKRSLSLEHFHNDEEWRSYTDSAAAIEKHERERTPVNDENVGEHFELGLRDDEKFKNQIELAFNEKRLFVQSNEDLQQQYEQTEMACGVRENLPSASTNQLDESTRYGYGIPLPSPPPPSPPIRSLSLDSLSQCDKLSCGDAPGEEKMTMPNTDIRANCLDVNMRGETDDEGLYTYATSDTIRNSLGIIDDTINAFYDGSCNKNYSSNMDGVCTMEPYGPTYAVLEPEETENCDTNFPSVAACSSETNSNARSKNDSDVNVYQALIQNGLDKYYTIQKPLPCP